MDIMDITEFVIRELPSILKNR